MCALSEFRRAGEKYGLIQVKTDDWSKAVQPFWWAVVRSAFSLRTLALLLLSGINTIQGAFAMLLMIRGFQKNVIVFGIMAGRKK